MAAIRFSPNRYLSATLWKSDVVLASEQSLPQGEEFTVELSDGSTRAGKLCGRDSGTNIAALQLSEPASASGFTAADLHAGALALAYGSDGVGGIRSRLGIVHTIGPAWHSQAGGRIDQRIVLDMQLSRAEDGGPVLNASGGFIGITTLGSHGEVLVIPAQTIERVVPVLLRDGRVPRGWLGVALQPVAVPDSLREVAGQRSGMMVMSSIDGGPAANAGVIAGDILLTIDGTSARRVSRGGARLDAERIGQEIELRLIRGGAVISERAVIGARP